MQHESEEIPQNSLSPSKPEAELSKQSRISKKLPPKPDFVLDCMRNNSRLTQYNGLIDKHLAPYFSNGKLRGHLYRMGLITEKGHVIEGKRKKVRKIEPILDKSSKLRHKNSLANEYIEKLPQMPAKANDSHVILPKIYLSNLKVELQRGRDTGNSMPSRKIQGNAEKNHSFMQKKPKTKLESLSKEDLNKVFAKYREKAGDLKGNAENVKENVTKENVSKEIPKANVSKEIPKENVSKEINKENVSKEIPKEINKENVSKEIPKEIPKELAKEKVKEIEKNSEIMEKNQEKPPEKTEKPAANPKKNSVSQEKPEKQQFFIGKTGENHENEEKLPSNNEKKGSFVKETLKTAEKINEIQQNTTNIEKIPENQPKKQSLKGNSEENALKLQENAKNSVKTEENPLKNAKKHEETPAIDEKINEKSNVSSPLKEQSNIGESPLKQEKNEYDEEIFEENIE